MSNFIERANKIHGNKYDYSKVEYINNRTKICIICPEHGEFWQTPKNHLNGSKCPLCALSDRKNKRKKDINKVLRDFNFIHKNKYDYSKVEYVNNRTKVCIICPEHGEFWQTPTSHLAGQGCPKCAGRFMNREYFIEKANKIHNFKYNYDLIKYIDIHTKVCIICPEHGEFWQTPHHHLAGFGCKKCSGNFSDKNMFIEKAQQVHGDKYDYSKVDYVNNRTKVCIICPEHGEFWQIPNSHLNGKGCKLCKDSHLERDMRKFLINNDIKFVYQYHNKDFLGKQSFDFYLPEYNIAIECQGEQHFISNFYKSKGIEHSEKHLKYIQELDERKKEICIDKNIKLVYFLDKKFNKYIKEGDYLINKEDDLLSFF